MFPNRSPYRLGLVLLVCALGLTCDRETAIEAEVPGGSSATALANALPGGAQIVVSGRDLGGFWERMTQTQLYAELAAIEGVKEAFTPLAAMQTEFLQETGLTLDEETVMAVFGERFDLGYYGPLENDRVDLLLIADVADASRVEEILGALETRVAADEGVVFSDGEYEGVKIREARSPDGQRVLFRALDDDVLTLATTQARLAEALDMNADRGAVAAMSAAEDYATALARLPASDVTVYVDPRAIQEAAMQAAEEGVSDPAELERVRAASEAFGAYNYARAFAAGLSWTDDGLQLDQYTLLNPGARTGFARIFGTSSAASRTLALQPVSTLFYAALNTFDPQATYEELRRFAVDATRAQMSVAGTADSLRGDAEVDEAIARFERDTGLDIEDDILSWIGDEISLSITGIDRSGFIPLPELVIAITTRDPVNARTAWAKIETLLSETARDQASIPLTWQSEEIPGGTIRTTSAQFVQLAYVVLDDVVIVATGPGLIRRMIDADGGAVESLAASPSFQAMGDFYPDEVTGIGFVDVEKTLTEVEGLIQSLSPMTGGAGADSTSTGRQVLRALKNAPRLGFYGRADEDGYFGRWLLVVE